MCECVCGGGGRGGWEDGSRPEHCIYGRSDCMVHIIIQYIWMQTYSSTLTHAHTHICGTSTLTHSHIHSHTFTHTRTHAHMHKHTHKCKHTHAHILYVHVSSKLCYKVTYKVMSLSHCHNVTPSHCHAV